MFTANLPSNRAYLFSLNILVMLAGWINRQQQAIEYLKEENRILREKLGGKRVLLTDSQRRRLAILGKRLGRELLGRVCCAFSPDTLPKWHRKLVAKKYDGSKNRSKYGRPRISDELKQLIIDMARDHKHLGCRKPHGYLKYLGLKVSSATISRVLREHGIEPSPLDALTRIRSSSYRLSVGMHGALNGP